MSSLIFLTNENEVAVATDTLAVDLEGRPAFFTTKMVPVPHLRMIVAATGAAGFAGEWFTRINDRMVVRDISNLDFHTPDCLREDWARFKAARPGGDGVTVTVYHFGFDAETDYIRSFAYRSTNDFDSEELEYGLATKPECTVPTSGVFPEAFVQMMNDQRERQAQNPVNKRIFIGGAIQVAHLTRSGFNLYELHRFDDYDQSLYEIFENHGRNAG